MQAEEKRVTPLMKKKRNIMLRKVSVAAAVIIVIAAIATAYLYTLSSSVAVHYISASVTTMIAHNGMFYFKLPNDASTYLIALENTSGSGALIYLTKTPVLNGPIYAIFMMPNEGINISASGANVADLHISLLGVNSSYAKFAIEPIDIGLGIKAASVPAISPRVFVEQALYTGNVSVLTTTTSTTSTSTTVLTTVVANALPVAQVMELANGTSIGILMNGYKALYEKDRACSAGVYNATYYKYFGTYPSGPNSFENASAMMPTDINVTVGKTSSSDVYSVTYYAVSNSKYTSGPIFAMTINITNGIIGSPVYEGIFRGLNYTQVNAAYQFQNSIQNYCGAYIPYTP
ncbi:MAG: hypothetical protein ACP5K9_03065 [Candidatus Micrarchaeia archaeon]